MKKANKQVKVKKVVVTLNELKNVKGGAVMSFPVTPWD